MYVYALSVSHAYSIFLVPSFPLNLCSVFCFHLASARYISTWYQSARVENLCSRFQLDTKNPNLGEKQEKWIEGCLAHFQLRSSIEATMHRGRTRCTNTCSGMDTGPMSMEQMTQHRNRHTDTSRPRNKRRAEFSTASRPM